MYTPQNLLVSAILALTCLVNSLVPAKAITVVQLGDSIALGTQPYLELELPGHTIIHPELSNLSFPSNNQGTKQWLAVDSGFTEPRYVRRLNQVPDRDLVLANVGIHNMRTESAFGTTPELYEQHLNQIFDTLESLNVPIVWVTTTPIPFDHPTIEESRQADYRQNELAVVSQRADVVVDAYSLLVDDFEEHPWREGPENLHLNSEGSQRVAGAIATAITGLLAAQAVAIPEPSAVLGCLCLAAFFSSRRPRNARQKNAGE